MPSRTTVAVCHALLAASLLTSTGCLGFIVSPELGLITLPIPISPYQQQKREDEFWVRERYARVPILGPITQGGPVRALDPPSEDEVIRALPPHDGGIPFLWERQRNNVRIEVEPIADYVDPPRFYPLIGPAVHHHAHYRCTVYYTERTYHGWPIPYTTTDEDAREVVFIDHNHLHLVDDPNVGGNY